MSSFSSASPSWVSSLLSLCINTLSSRWSLSNLTRRPLMEEPDVSTATSEEKPRLIPSYMSWIPFWHRQPPGTPHCCCQAFHAMHWYSLSSHCDKSSYNRAKYPSRCATHHKKTSRYIPSAHDHTHSRTLTKNVMLINRLVDNIINSTFPDRLYCLWSAKKLF